MDLRKAPFWLNDRQIHWVEATRAGMTVGEMLGQLFVVMGGDYSAETLEKMVAQGRIGGILFRPVKTGEEIRRDYAPLDKAAKVPLLKAANLEEGGSGGMCDGTLYGWPMLTAATDDAEEAARFGRVCGEEGRSIGVNITYSPVCDLDLNFRNPITNVRTFGSDKDRVKKMTQAYMEAVQATGMAACAKHFPGDGVDFRDQHLHPSYNTLTAEQWYDSYGEIYRNLIGHGLKSIMVGHIGQPNVAMNADPGLPFEEAMMPATLNETLLKKVLREKLGFNGLITTDATIMAGFTQVMPRRQALPRAIMSGCDMLVFNTDFEEDYRILQEAFQAGELTRERLEEAVTRILALKASVCTTQLPEVTAPGGLWHRACADKAITMVKNPQRDKLPMTPKRYPEIRLITLGRDAIQDGSVREIAKTYLEKNGFQVRIYNWEADDLHGSGDLPQDRLTLYLANYEQWSNQVTIRPSWCPKHALDVPRHVTEEVCVFVSLANPYHLQDVPRIKTYVNAYTATRATIELTLDKLMGKSEFTGINPVDPFCNLPDTRL